MTEFSRKFNLDYKHGMIIGDGVGGARVFKIVPTQEFTDAWKRTHVLPLPEAGWLETEENLSQEGWCWVANDSVVKDNARVEDDAVVNYNSVISGNGIVRGKGRVTYNCDVSGNAIVCDQADVCYHADVRGHAIIGGRMFVEGGVISGESE